MIKKSKLPEVGTSIFAVMSKMANDHQAINLSQGFPEFPVAEELIDLVYRNMQMGHNQYAPMAGLPALLEAIAHKIAQTHNRKVDAQTEITICCGASEAIFSSVAALIKNGDEVIVLEPAYDSYIPAVKLAGGHVKTVALDTKTFRPDWELVRASITEHTRMLIINTPHNPSGAIFNESDIAALKEILHDFPELILLSDEVYEHIIFDNKTHLSVLKDDFLAKRSIAVFSFGKTFHATGWKIGYAVAPAAITAEIRKVHQYNTYTIHTPTQHALAEYLQDEAHYLALGNMYEAKRDFFRSAMSASKFNEIPCSGSYYQLFDYSEITDEHDMAFATRLTKEHGVAAIPVSSFYEQRTDNKLLRFCFAKGEDTLEKAADILCKI